MKPIYFLSDAHLGSLAIPHRRMHERRLVNFLDSVKHKAAAVYLLGDIFDFWYEYRMVVPKGFTRFLGKVSELTDLGVEVHYFVGNHDQWMGDYLREECGVVVHKEPQVAEIYGKLFFLGHGDGLGCTDRSFRILRWLFRNRLCRALFSALHPRWGVAFGLAWAKHSRLKHERRGEPVYQGEEREELVQFSHRYLQSHESINYFIFGHRHIELDLQLARESRLLILGDWISAFTYAVFDGEHLLLERFIEGESQP